MTDDDLVVLALLLLFGKISQTLMLPPCLSSVYLVSWNFCSDVQPVAGFTSAWLLPLITPPSLPRTGSRTQNDCAGGYFTWTRTVSSEFKWVFTLEASACGRQGFASDLVEAFKIMESNEIQRKWRPGPTEFDQTRPELNWSDQTYPEPNFPPLTCTNPTRPKQISLDQNWSEPTRPSQT